MISGILAATILIAAIPLVSAPPRPAPKFYRVDTVYKVLNYYGSGYITSDWRFKSYTTAGPPDWAWDKPQPYVDKIQVWVSGSTNDAEACRLLVVPVWEWMLQDIYMKNCYTEIGTVFDWWEGYIYVLFCGEVLQFPMTMSLNPPSQYILIVPSSNGEYTACLNLYPHPWFYEDWGDCSGDVKDGYYDFGIAAGSIVDEDCVSYEFSIYWK